MSIKTMSEKLNYAREMLTEVQKWASPSSPEVEFWRKVVEKYQRLNQKGL